jgi:pyruvate/2-oxoglutarate dehydrogenase complex dihydrolipoamide dehydrogenase (E3) component
MDRVRERRAAIAPNDSQERFESLGVDVFRGPARFVSPREVVVGDVRLRGAAFVIATGSRAALPASKDWRRPPYTNETIFDELRARPDGMIILAAAPSAASWDRPSRASACASPWSRRAPVSWRRRTRTWPTWSQGDGGGRGHRAHVRPARGGLAGRSRLRVELTSPAGEEMLEAEALLVAAGRRPNVEDSGLEAAGVASRRRA